MKLNIDDSCGQAQQTMDLLSSNSLAALDKSAFERHLSLCPTCAQEFSDRRQIKELLKRAFENTPAAPASLRLSIQNLVRAEA